MAERKNLNGLTLTNHDGVTLMTLGEMEIWDGADLSLLRDGLNYVIRQQQSHSIAVDMRTVKYVPSGFFGMLFDWFEQGVAIRLFGPQDRVRNMMWFRQFFADEPRDWCVLHDGLNSDSAEMDAWREEEWDRSIDEPVTADH